MKMMEAVRTCFKKYVDFSGRARRSEYWKFSLFNVLVSVVIMVVAALFSDTPEKTGAGFAAISGLSGLYTLVALLPGIAASVRRLHDVGRSGGYMLFALIPAVGAIMLLIWLIQDSDPGDNQYGPNPKSTAVPGPKPSPEPVPSPEQYWTCPACGEKVKESASFCTHCGKPRHSSAAFTSTTGTTGVTPVTPAKPPEPFADRGQPDLSEWKVFSQFYFGGI